jgi:hypothetical protein
MPSYKHKDQMLLLRIPGQLLFPPSSVYLRNFWTALLSVIGWLMTGYKSIVVSLGQLSPKID